MPVDYEAITAENLRRYGTDVGRWGQLILQDRYEDPAHFVYELLQNAEDALRRRGSVWKEREIVFDLNGGGLTVSHFGKPFDEGDVRGICGIAEGNKGVNDVGKFGIGFKAVYAYAQAPRVYSGDERFAIDSYVRPRPVDPVSLREGETRFVLPFRPETGRDLKQEVWEGFRLLTSESLVFLRELRKVTLRVDGQLQGVFSVDREEKAGADGCCEVQTSILFPLGGRDREEVCNWLVFSRDVEGEDRAGSVELAFKVEGYGVSRRVVRVDESNLAVMFPTVVDTGLGFLLQGPFVTTPNRDNVPFSVTWNRRLVRESAQLLLSAILGLKELGCWGVSALCSMPINGDDFSGSNERFLPLHLAFWKAAEDHPLIPDRKGSFMHLGQCVLGEPAALVNLFTFEDLSELFLGELVEPGWVDSGVSRTRAETEDLFACLVAADVKYLTRQNLSGALGRRFLESRGDSWIRSLYEFYSRGEIVPVRNCAFLRLADGQQVVFDRQTQNGNDGAKKVYLPGPVDTDLLTVKREVVDSRESRSFLSNLDIEVATFVKDVRFNVLPKYRRPLGDGDRSDEDYRSDLVKVAAAHRSAGSELRRLESDLRDVYFIRSFDCGTGISRYRRYRQDYPYVPSRRLQQLFEGVTDVEFADPEGGQLWVDLGLPVNLSVVERTGVAVLGDERRLALLADSDVPAGDVSEEKVSDFSLLGCRNVFQRFAELPFEEAAFRAGLLWACLGELSEALPVGSYTWQGPGGVAYRREFRSEAIDLLHREPWVPVNGRLLRVGEASLEYVGWQRSGPAHSSLQFRSDEGAVPETLNERQGRQVEDVVRQMFIAEGFEVDRTGTGSDWSARCRGREWLIEVKSTVGAGFVEVTSAQAQTGLERSGDFVLCVVSGVLVVAGDVDRQSVEENVRFVFDGKEVFGGVGSDLERALGALTESIGKEVSLDYDYSAVRVRVASSLWERLGVDFETALARMRG